MKTAEEWANETSEIVMSDCFAGDRSARPGDPTINHIKRILLDGIKEGMRRAAEIGLNRSPMNGNEVTTLDKRLTITHAILSAAEQLTEKDI